MLNKLFLKYVLPFGIDISQDIPSQPRQLLGTLIKLDAALTSAAFFARSYKAIPSL